MRKSYSRWSLVTVVSLGWKWIVRAAKVITGKASERREACPVEIEID